MKPIVEQSWLSTSRTITEFPNLTFRKPLRLHITRSSKSLTCVDHSEMPESFPSLHIRFLEDEILFNRPWRSKYGNLSQPLVRTAELSFERSASNAVLIKHLSRHT